MSDHIPDLTKMIGETPRTDAAWKPDGGDGYPTVDVDLARQLERELNAANERIRLLIAERDTARLQADQKYKLREEFTDLLGTDGVEQGVAVVREMKDRIKRLEEAGDKLEYASVISEAGEDPNGFEKLLIAQLEWRKAKEEKP